MPVSSAVQNRHIHRYHLLRPYCSGCIYSSTIPVPHPHRLPLLPPAVPGNLPDWSAPAPMRLLQNLPHSVAPAVWCCIRYQYNCHRQCCCHKYILPAVWTGSGQPLRPPDLLLLSLCWTVVPLPDRRHCLLPAGTGDLPRTPAAPRRPLPLPRSG